MNSHTTATAFAALSTHPILQAGTFYLQNLSDQARVLRMENEQLRSDEHRKTKQIYELQQDLYRKLEQIDELQQELHRKLKQIDELQQDNQEREIRNTELEHAIQEMQHVYPWDPAEMPCSPPTASYCLAASQTEDADIIGEEDILGKLSTSLDQRCS